MADHKQLISELRMKLAKEIDALRNEGTDSIQEVILDYQQFTWVLLNSISWSDSKLALVLQRDEILGDLTKHKNSLYGCNQRLLPQDFNNIVKKYIKEEYYPVRMERLLSILQKDYDDYLLRSKTPGEKADDNVDGATIRQKIISYIKADKPDIQDVDALLVLDHPLEKICEYMSEGIDEEECIYWAAEDAAENLLCKYYPITQDDVYDYYDNYIPAPELMEVLETRNYLENLNISVRLLQQQLVSEYKGAYFKDIDPKVLYEMRSVFFEFVEGPYVDAFDAAVLRTLETPMTIIADRVIKENLERNEFIAINRTIAERRKELNNWIEHIDTLTPQQYKAVSEYFREVSFLRESLEDEGIDR